MKENSSEIQALHDTANAAEELFYTDPNSGLLVQTEHAHKTRGYCCESGCRHCPYGFTGKKPSKASKPTIRQKSKS